LNIAQRILSQKGWRRVSLGEVLTLINRRAYKQDELLEQGTPVIRIQNLNGGDKWYYSDLKLPDDKYCENGDLLFAWSATFGPYFWSGSKGIYHYHIWKIVPSKNLDKNFAFYLLQSITERVKASGRGISMIHMTKAGMEAWEVNIPPLDEQRRIAAILGKEDALRRKRKRALDLLENLTQSIFLETFGDPVIATSSAASRTW
jgi:type I restriction enzyme S subunit